MEAEWRRRRGERRLHPLGNKPWKEEFQHQESSLEKKLRQEASMEEKNERERERKGHRIEGEKEGEKLNFEGCLTRFLFIKVTSVTHTSFYSLGH